MEKPKNSEESRLTRREAMGRVALTGLGIASLLSGTDKIASLAAQGGGGQQPILPDKDPRYPMPPTWPRELRQLAPNIYAYTQGGGPNIPNVGVSNPGMIAGPDYLWAIDGTQGPAPAKAFIAASKQATGKDFGRLLLSHHHGDHTGGLQFFQKAEVWSHPYCRDEVLKAAATAPKMWTPNPNQPGNAADISEPRKTIVPMLTFDDDMTVFIGNVEARFMYAGPAHTWGDMMVYLPKQKILFANDVAFFWVAPFAQNGYISKWIATCDKILGMDVDVIVPGHGPIGGKKELSEMADYFRTLTVEARKRYDAKMTPGAAAADIRLGRFDNWIGTQLIITDTVRLYDEWDGTLTPDVDQGGTRAATQEYNQIKKAAGKTAEMIPLERMDYHLAHSC